MPKASDTRRFGVDDYNLPGYWAWWQETYGDERSRPVTEAMEKFVRERHDVVARALDKLHGIIEEAGDIPLEGAREANAIIRLARECRALLEGHFRRG